MRSGENLEVGLGGRKGRGEKCYNFIISSKIKFKKEEKEKINKSINYFPKNKKERKY